MSDSVGMPRWVGTLVGGVALTGAIVFPAISSAATLPVPCLPGACSNLAAFAHNDNPAFVSSGQATATQTGNQLTINQTTNQATLNWKSFNISSDGKVQFVQPNTGSVALNRIYDQSPSSILGQLSANGQIYLINPNGFLFGNGAKVNTAGIIASSLQISDENFATGLLAPSLLAKISQTSNINQSAALSSTDGTDTAQYAAGDVTVEAGAQISSPGGRILLAAPKVQNAGTLSAPDGQVILAAGQEVFLQASGDPALRGLVVEVNQGGKAWNQLLGQISADRGNISLIGALVNQDGRLSATTSVSANGSVRLEAGDTVNVTTSGASPVISATKGGTLQLGTTSQIELLPELASSATAVADQESPTNPHQLLLPSSVSLAGEKVFIEGGDIIAPGGQLNVTAAATPEPPPGGTQTLQPGNSDAQLRIHAGTNIDLSGSSIELPMSDNLLAIQLRANELADDPTQRNGALRGQTIYIDTRTGTPLIGSTALQAAIGTKAHGVGYYTTAGGTAKFESEGDVVLEQGATINVSGGKVTYDGGTLQTTQLIGANGKLVDVGKADPLQTYTGVVNPTFSQTYDKWGASQTQLIATPGLSHYYSGYVQGTSAGTVQFAAPALVLGGSLVGKAINGPLQRSGASVATGGTLILGLADGLPQDERSGLPPDFLTPEIEFVTRPTPVAVADGFAPFALPLELPIDYLTTGGFTNTQIYGDTRVTVPAGLPLNLLPGSNFQIRARQVDVNSNISDPSGTLSFQSVLTAAPAQNDIPRGEIEVGPGVTFDVRGLWTNDSQTMPGAVAPSGPTWQDGGSITLSQNVPGGELVIGDDVSFRASGGAWVSATNSLTGGAGGTISIVDAPLGSALQVGDGIRLDAFGVNGAHGGTFSFTAPRLLIDQGSSGAGWIDAQHIDDAAEAGSTIEAGGVITVHSPLFTDYGFNTINLTAAGAVAPDANSNDELTVAANTQIEAVQQTLLLNSDFLRHPTGGTIDAFSHLTAQALFQRVPVAINLSVIPVGPADASLLHGGRIDVQAGSRLSTDPGGTISLNSIGGVYVDGTLRAPGGTITLQTVNDVEDGGYLPDLQIELGKDAVLDASGAVVMTPNQLGLRLGNVLSGGAVNLFANRGTVLADVGSKIDVSGITATLDIPAAMGSGMYIGRNVAGAAGSISVRSPLAISLLGDLRARAGKGDYGNPSGGSLEVDLTRSQGWFTPPTGSDATPYPDVQDVVQIVSDTSKTAASAPDSGLAMLGVSQLQSAGFDSLRLSAGNTIRFSTSNPLALGKQIVLDSPIMAVDPGVQANIAANYIGLGQALPSATAAPTVTAGTGTFNAHAQQIDLTGYFGFSGTAAVTLASDGDVSMSGVGEATTPAGALVTPGDLTINASRIYPYTLTSYSLTASGDGSAIRIGQTNPSAGVPLSAAGALTLNADVIDSSGTLMAPFGTITLNAGNSLTLEAGSVTSVSGAGTVIPFGQTQTGGSQWVYFSNNLGTNLPITAIPDRDVKLTSPSVSVASGATIDLSGGGDLQAYEFVPGTGGTQDALAANSSVIPGLYAIIPGMHGPFGPQDPQESVAGTPAPGGSIYLSGGGGVAAGTYALLPARYALLPGAYLVKVESGYSNIVPGQKATLADGTSVVAGYLTFGSSGFHDAGYQGVAIWPGSYGQELSGYTISEASTFFAAAAAAADKPIPDLPVNAGRLSIIVGGQLDLSGKLLGQAAKPDGDAAQIDISATRLEVTGSEATSQPGTVTIAAAQINGWHAGSLVLGGTLSSDRSSIQVAADSVTLDKGAQIQAGQVILTAGQSIDLQSGSTLSSNSASNSNSLALPKGAAIALTGDSAPGAALLAVSDQMLPIAARTGTSSTPATLSIESGATVASRGAIAIDAPGNVQIDGTVNGKGANWSLSSGSIGVLGRQGTDSLQIGAPLLASMQNAGAVDLSATTAINLYQAFALGANTSIGSISLTAPAVNYAAASGGADASGTASFNAQTISLAGIAGQTATSPTAGTGNLVFNAQEIDVGASGLLPNTTDTSNTPPASGQIALGGVASTQLNASSLVVGTGKGGGLSTSGDLTLAAPMITAANAASTSFAAAGTLTLRGSSTPAGTLPTSYLGGALDFNANTISQQGAIVVPSGVVTMEAQNITLGSGARTDVSGVGVTIGDQVVGSEGGRIALNASQDLTLAAGSTLAASGGTGSPAGQISLTAGGVADVGSTLLGKEGAGAQGGRLSLDAGSLTQDFTTLANSLQSGGFNQQVSVRVRQGDLDLNSGAQLTANQVSLSSDTGSIDVAGVIKAPDSDIRGSISLFGGGGVTVASTGELHADTTGESGLGGDIELGTAGSGSVAIQSGAKVSATGSAADGRLLVRAPLATGATDIPVTIAQGSVLKDLGQIVIEPVMTQNATSTPSGTSMTAADFTRIQNAVTTGMNAAAANVASRLNATTPIPVTVQAGIDIVHDGDLTVAIGTQNGNPNPNFNNWRFAGQPGDITFRTSGNLTVTGTMSDGFNNTQKTGVTNRTTTGINDGPASSFRLVAGADTASANPLGILDGTNEKLTIGSSSAAGVIRTTTGDIDLVSSGDIVFAPWVGTSPRAQVYTAGAPAATAVTVRNSNSVFNFPTQGGNIFVSAGDDIEGAAIPSSSGIAGPSVTTWQVRQGSGSLPAQWGVDLGQYALWGWNLGSLGGGDVRVSSGSNLSDPTSITTNGSMSNLSAAAADSYIADTSTHLLSGGLDVRAAGDIGSGLFYQATGSEVLNAGGGFTAIRTDSSGVAGSLIALADTQVSMQARLGAVIGGVVNPTTMAQGAGTGGQFVGAFFTYTADSSLNVQSSAGDVVLDDGHVGALVGSAVAAGAGGGGQQLYPATLVGRALSGDLRVIGLTMFPSATGQLELLAGRDVAAGTSQSIQGLGKNQPVMMSDPLANSIATADNVTGDTPFDLPLQQYRFQGNLHTDDAAPALIEAGRDIVGLGASIPKSTELVAGRDIVNLTFLGENLHASDVTLMSAGRDYIDTLDIGSGAIVQVAGPGSLDVLAGRNVDLGISAGIETVGNLNNANLPTATGSNLTIMAGLGQSPDYSALLGKIVDGDSGYQGKLVSYVESINGATDMSFADAQSYFTGQLTTEQRRGFLNSVFFNELLLSGREANTAGGNFKRGYAAIDTLFPNSRTDTNGGNSSYAGNLSLDFSQIYTLSGGNISLLVPGGSVNVGLAVAPANLQAKAADQLGIVASGPGDINIYSKNDVDVNASRVFTLGGGNILIWSNEGSIDAGQGAKTSVSAPAPRVLVDPSGKVTLDFSGAVAGSGIRTIQVSPDVPPGNVDLIAPVGTVNAGDAGIGASGNINIAAQHVLGLDNIQVGGQATGVPSSVSDLGVTLSSAASAASSATNSATSSAEDEAKRAQAAAVAPLAQAAISWLDVFVTGLGEENCKPDDMACLKRQKTD